MRKLIVLISLFIFLTLGVFGQVNLISTTPITNANSISRSSNITLNFDANIDQLTIDNGTVGDPTDDNIIISGSQTGLISGTYSGEGTSTIIFNTINDFKPGEIITVSVTANVLSTGVVAIDPKTFQFSVASGQGSGTFPSGQNIVSSTAIGAISVFSVDLDDDGDMDVLSASLDNNKVAWYENDGSQIFSENIISTSANGAISVFSADVDNDGDLDVLSASVIDNKIAWYENNGSQVFTEHSISTTANSAWSVFAIDLDNDGDLDVLSASAGDDKIAWYENNGSQIFTEQSISTGADAAKSVYATDVDNDGDMDVLSASENDSKIAWYENNGSQVFTEQVISTSALGAISVYAIDVDSDGDLDVLSASQFDSKIAWYDNNGSQLFTEKVITTSASGAFSVFVIDVDGDSDMDVLSASEIDNKIAWYENDGGQTFTERSISSSASGANSVYAADVDDDGDMDVLSSSYEDNKIAWYENYNIGTEITAFSFAEQTSPATIGTGTVDIEVANGTDLINLIATFTLSAGASATIATVPQVSATTTNDFSSDVTYVVTAEDGTTTQNWVVSVTEAPSTSTEITAFSFAEQTGPATIGVGTITVEVANGTDLTNLIAIFTLSAGASATIATVPQVSATTTNDFSSDVTYVVTAEDGTTTQNWVVSVTEAPSTSTVITAFSFAEQTGAAAIGSGTISVEVANGTDLSSLVATFTLSAGATAKVGTTAQVSGTTANDFSSGVTYVVTAEDGVTTQNWVVTVTIANSAPSELSISSDQVDENQPSGTLVGQFSTVDADAGDSHLYTLVTGTGDEDNASFTITGNELLTAAIFDFETKSSYSILVQTDDQNGGTFQKAFTIFINDLNETSLVAYYPFNGNANDESFNGNDGIINGALLTSDRFGNSNSAFLFNGINNGLDFTNQEYLSPGLGDYTFNAWVKYEPDAGGQHIFDINGSTGENVPWIQISGNGTTDEIKFGLQSGAESTKTEVSYSGLKDGKWHMVTGVRKDQFSVLLYIDGVLQGSISNPNLGDVDTNVPGYILRVGYTPGQGGRFNDGPIDDISIYNEALTLAEISELYTMGGWPVLSTETDVLAFKIEGQVEDEAFNGTDISLTMPAGTNLTSLTPTITLSEGATIIPASGSARDFTNKVTYTVTAEDGVTTQDWGVTVTEAQAPVDTEDPSISFTTSPPTELEAGNLNIQVNASDNVGVTSVNMLHSGLRSDGSTWTSLAATDQGSGVWSAEVSISMLDELGVALYFEASDAAGNTAQTSTVYIYKSFTSTSAPDLPNSVFGVGGTASSWRMFSIPYELDNNNISNIFESALGAYDKSQWRLIRYQASSNSFVEYKSGLNTIDLGKGYWFNAASSAKIPDIVLGNGSLPKVAPGTLASIPLDVGWTQIGNPYPWAIIWSDVLSFNGSDAEGLKVFSGGTTLSDATVLEPFAAAYVFSDGSDVEVPFTTNPSSRARIKEVTNPLEEDHWEVPISIESGEFSNHIGKIGMSPEANDDKDNLDAMRVPRFVKYTDITFQHPEFWYPWFSGDVVPRQEAYTWEFEASNNTGEPVMLKWDNSYFGDNEYELILEDMENGKIVTMHGTDYYAFEADSLRKFKVYYGKADDLLKNLSFGIVMGAPYPNPFTSSAMIPFTLPDKEGDYIVRMEVYNVLGHQMEVLLDRSFLPGIHTVEWDGLVNSGKQAENGLYFIIMKITSDTKNITLSQKILKR